MLATTAHHIVIDVLPLSVSRDKVTVLDYFTRAGLLDLARHRAQERQMVVAFVSQDVRGVARFSDRVLVMGDKPGNILAHLEIPATCVRPIRELWRTSRITFLTPSNPDTETPAASKFGSAIGNIGFTHEQRAAKTATIIASSKATFCRPSKSNISPELPDPSTLFTGRRRGDSVLC